MKRFLGLSPWMHVYLNFALVAWLALDVREGMAPDRAVLVGFVTFVLAYATLAIRCLVNPPKPPPLSDRFPWHKLLVGNAINVGGLAMLYSDRMSGESLAVAAILTFVGGNGLLLREWRWQKRTLAERETKDLSQR